MVWGERLYDLATDRARRPDYQGSHVVISSGVNLAALNVREAKIAEQDILHQSQLRKTLDPVERETLEAEFHRDRERLVSERDAKIERVRRGEPR